MEYMGIDKLEPRRAYELKSRNLVVGFWNPRNKGFMGVREKFGDRYLFTEYHYDTGAPNGTAMPVRELDLWLPEDVPFRENLELACQLCGNLVEQVFEPDDRYHSGQRCVGHRHLNDTECAPPNPHFGYLPMNVAAFALLDPYDKEINRRQYAEWEANG